MESAAADPSLFNTTDATTTPRMTVSSGMTPEGRLGSDRRCLSPPRFLDGLNETLGFDRLAHSNGRRTLFRSSREIQVCESVGRSVAQSHESQRRQTHVPDFKDASARKLKSLIRS
jgi:hypothetical protein